MKHEDLPQEFLKASRVWWNVMAHYGLTMCSAQVLRESLCKSWHSFELQTMN